jgi:hypothetical protein
MRVLSTKRRCDTIMSLVTATEKPETSPPPTTWSIILLEASMIITTSKGDKGSPWRRPLELSKKPHELPLMRIEKRAVEMQ